MEYPPEDVVRATLDQVAFDAGVMQTAAAQRQQSSHSPHLYFARFRQWGW
ncbi:MAG: hypothetical protein GY796_24085 [Chloroflexi bacterium]|nr:hypothetical protein [Chloroflexota bacterium]